MTGHPHRIEIWSAVDQDTLYMLSGDGDRSDWVKNLRRKPAVTVEIGTGKFEGRARAVTDPTEDEHAAPQPLGAMPPVPWRRPPIETAADSQTDPPGKVLVLRP